MIGILNKNRAISMNNNDNENDLIELTHLWDELFLFCESIILNNELYTYNTIKQETPPIITT